MIVQFPDGISFDTACGSTPVINHSTFSLYWLAPNGTFSASFYTASGYAEIVKMMFAIMDAQINKVPILTLTSDAPLPTSGNAAATDMFFNGVVSPLVIAGGSFVFLTIGTIAANQWPVVVGGTLLVACFRPDGIVTIGGSPVTNLRYVSGVTLAFNAPLLPTGVTYNLVYTDSRGTVSKLASVTY